MLSYAAHLVICPKNRKGEDDLYIFICLKNAKRKKDDVYSTFHEERTYLEMAT